MNQLATQNNSIVSLDTLDEKGRIRVAVAGDALSENTRTAYQEAYKRLDDNGTVVENLSDESLALAVAKLFKAGLAHATLALTVAGVKWLEQEKCKHCAKKVLTVNCRCEKVELIGSPKYSA